MADGPVGAAAEGAKTVITAPIRTPLLFLGIGLLFVTLLLIVEARKPNLVTGPIRRFLGAIHLLPAPPATK